MVQCQFMLRDKIYGILLAGGFGTRLWPLSTSRHPKPFLGLTGEKSLLQQTALRIQSLQGMAGLIVAGQKDHEILLQRQLQEIAVEPTWLILEEPASGTAISIALGCLAVLADAGPEAMVFVVPADHALMQRAALEQALQQAVPQAKTERLVVFGVQPDQPCSAYGYIACGTPLDEGVWKVQHFIEKPSLERAQDLLRQGGWLWNSGMLLGQAALLWQELQHRVPWLAQAAWAAWEKRRRTGRKLHVQIALPQDGTPLSIDHALLERIDRAAVVSLDTPWSDVGTFAALHALGEQDQQANVLRGHVVAMESTGNYLHNTGEAVLGVFGVHAMAVVATSEAILMAPLGNAAAVEQLARRCTQPSRDHARAPAGCHAAAQAGTSISRPWGSFSILVSGEGFQIKRLLVQPRSRISLQYHRQRREWWFVRQGCALVTVDARQEEHGAGAMIPIPMGAVHRLENAADEILEIIEMQMGEYLGEDDVVRLEDDYGRLSDFR